MISVRGSLKQLENLQKARMYYFILSGRCEALALDELMSLLKAFNVANYNLYHYTQLALVESRDVSMSILQSITARAGLIKEAGLVLALSDGSDVHVLEDLDVVTLAGRKVSKTSIRSASNCGVDILENYLSGISGLQIGGERAKIVCTEGIGVLGLTLAKLNTKEFKYREPSKRPFFRSIALPVYLSRTLVNLTAIRSGTILDPFCGTGSIAIEAALIGFRTICVDLDWTIASGSYRNLKYLNLSHVVQIAGDARSLPLTSSTINGVATDPPYGRAASTHREKVEELYSKFLAELSRVLVSGGRAVFMAPHWLSERVESLINEMGFRKISRRYLYVHGALTRLIYVVEKH